MNMPDHNIDELFRSKLGELEVMPSRNLWEGIAEGLETKDKRRMGLMSWLSIAASVLVMITAGVLFIPQKAHVNTQPANGSLAHGPVGKRLAVAVSQSAGAGQDTDAPAPTGQTVAANPAKAEPAQRAIDNRTDAPQQGIAKPTEAVLAMANKPAEDASPQTLQNAQQSGGVNIPDDPHNADQPLSSQLTANTDALKATAPVIAALPAPDKPAPKKHGIHNVGDLFNRVIARVDKRADKVLEFTETDDESDITGINLGFLAVKKDK